MKNKYILKKIINVKMKILIFKQNVLTNNRFSNKIYFIINIRTFLRFIILSNLFILLNTLNNIIITS